MNRLVWIIGVCAITVARSVGAAPFTLLNNGPASNRIDLFFLGDGYTQAEISLGVYDRDIEGYLDHLFNESGYLSDPFKRYQKFFNVYKANVASTQSGADIPHASPPVFVNTALDASYEYALDGLDDRGLEVSDAKADNARNNALAGSGITADMQFVTVNSSKYGGTGGPWAVFAGGNDEAHEIALHESGHSFAGLADEYGGFTTPYTGAEPTEPDVTKDPTGAKWSRWLGFHDPRGSNLNIGVYEGARYYDTGLYRPSLDSKMRELDQGFDAVSREQFILDFYKKVDPLDSWLGNKTTVTSGDLWVKSIDPNVIATKWYVNNTLVPGATGESFNPADFGFGNGTYQVRAHSYDTVLDHSYDGGMLDLVRTQYDLLQEDISWTYNEQIVKLPGDFNLNGVVDVADYVAWRNGLGTTYTAADYNTWRTHFGQEAGAGASAVTASVPEPTSAVLFVFGLLAVCSIRRGDTC
ncbi:MAG TPA: M64 family metallopeptidase [Lacipirellulaceae bacterium]|jgi:hypothetical protein|nr:M64 family metallopeptidase [Lacipirellulaceae bacterium]